MAAITTFAESPEIASALAQVTLHIWAATQGKQAPTAMDIATFFATEEEWPEEGQEEECDTG